MDKMFRVRCGNEIFEIDLRNVNDDDMGKLLGFAEVIDLTMPEGVDKATVVGDYEWAKVATRALDEKTFFNLLMRIGSLVVDSWMGPRAYDCLFRSKWHVEYVFDLALRSEAELLEIAGIGPKRLKRIKDMLAELGLSLGMSLWHGESRIHKQSSGALSKLQEEAFQERQVSVRRHYHLY